MNPSLPSDSRSPGSTRAFRLALAALVVPAFLLRRRHLDLQILGGDEILLLRLFTRSDLGAIWSSVEWGDVSIPMALLARLVSNAVPLSEAMMRAPILVIGACTPSLLGWGARRFVGEAAALLLALVAAVHPFFIFYSRFLRPYGLCALLLFGALVFLDRWHRNGRKGSDLVAAVLFAGFASWLNLVSLSFAGCLFAGAVLRTAMDSAGGSVGARLRGSGAATCAGAGVLCLAIVAALYAPALPAIFDVVLADKVGAGEMNESVLARNAAVLSGMPGTVPFVAFAALIVAGAAIRVVTDRSSACLLLVPAFVHPFLILLSKPLLVEFSFVLARYAFYSLPLWILLAATALVEGSRAASRRLPARARGRATAAAAAVAGAVAWWALGPYASIYGWPNAYAHHNGYQTFRHLTDWPLSLWRKEGRRAVPASVPEYYETIEDERLVLEWPAPQSFDQNVLALYQWRHRRPMRVLALEYDPSTPLRPTPELGDVDLGERIDPWSSDRLALRNVVVIREGVPLDLGEASLVIVHKNLPSEVWASIRARPAVSVVVPYVPRDAVRTVSGRLAEICGPPIHEDDFLRVFRVPDDRGRG